MALIRPLAELINELGEFFIVPLPIFHRHTAYVYLRMLFCIYVIERIPNYKNVFQVLICPKSDVTSEEAVKKADYVKEEGDWLNQLAIDLSSLTIVK